MSEELTFLDRAAIAAMQALIISENKEGNAPPSANDNIAPRAFQFAMALNKQRQSKNPGLKQP